MDGHKVIFVGQSNSKVPLGMNVGLSPSIFVGMECPTRPWSRPNTLMATNGPRISQPLLTRLILTGRYWSAGRMAASSFRIMFADLERAKLQELILLARRSRLAQTLLVRSSDQAFWRMRREPVRTTFRPTLLQ